MIGHTDFHCQNDTFFTMMQPTPLATGMFVLQNDTTFSRNSPPEVFLGKSILKICIKFTGEHPCQSVILIKLLATLLKSHLGMGVLLEICCIFSEHIFIRTVMKGCFWSWCDNFYADDMVLVVIKLMLKRVIFIFWYVSTKRNNLSKSASILL